MFNKSRETTLSNEACGDKVFLKYFDPNPRWLGFVSQATELARVEWVG